MTLRTAFITPGPSLPPFFVFYCIILAIPYCSCLRPLFEVPSAWNAPAHAPDTFMALSLTPSQTFTQLSPYRGLPTHRCQSAPLSQRSPFLLRVSSTALTGIWHIICDDYYPSLAL